MSVVAGGNEISKKMCDEREENRYIIVLPPNIIGIANDKDQSIQDYAIFYQETMNTGIVRPEITANHFEFKLKMFQMLQTMGKFSGSP